MKFKEVETKDLVIGQTYCDMPFKGYSRLVYVGTFPDEEDYDAAYFYPIDDPDEYHSDKDGTVPFPIYDTWYEEV